MRILFELKITEHFDSAHYLREYVGKCKNVHGHTWNIEVIVKGENLNEIGLLIDFNDLKKVVKELIKSFDHQLLNEIPPFDKINPSSENLARYFYYEIKNCLAAWPNIAVSRVLVSESQATAASYYED